MNKIKRNFKAMYNNQRGSTILLITVLILSSVLVVTLTASEIIRIGLMMSKNQLDAAKAFYAAEAGAEQVLWEARRTGGFDFTSCFTNGCLGFTAGQITSCDNSCAGANVITLSNDSNYKIKYDSLTAAPDTIITCYGKYKDVNRTVELRF